MTDIQLGDKVKCKYTGFTGIATARTEFINGCVQFLVAPKWDGKTTDVVESGIDENSLEVIKPKPKPKRQSRVNFGGPSTKIHRRNF